MNATLVADDLVEGYWTADEYAYKGFAHKTITWNGWRICYFTDEVMQRIVEDIAAFDLPWRLTIEDTPDGERVLEITDTGEMVPFAQPITVEGIGILWDTQDSGWAWDAAQDACGSCGDLFPVQSMTDQTREGYDPVRVMVCPTCLEEESNA